MTATDSRWGRFTPEDDEPQDAPRDDVPELDAAEEPELWVRFPRFLTSQPLSWLQAREYARRAHWTLAPEKSAVRRLHTAWQWTGSLLLLTWGAVCQWAAPRPSRSGVLLGLAVLVATALRASGLGALVPDVLTLTWWWEVTFS